MNRSLNRRSYLKLAAQTVLAGSLAACDANDSKSSTSTAGTGSSGGSTTGTSGTQTDGDTDSGEVTSLLATGRTFGITGTEPQSGDFGPNVISHILASNATSTSLSVYWDDIETASGIYAPSVNYLDIANLFYSNFSLSLNLGFSVIDTTNKRLPNHLLGQPFDAPIVINAFKSMLDWAVTQVPNIDIQSIHIGNEVDVYLAAHPEEWDAWISFFTETTAHAKLLWPKAIVGSKTTHNGIMGPDRNQCIQLHSGADATLLTYYHMDNDFQVLDPTDITDVFADMAEFPVDKPVYVLEIGSPSSAINGGSESHQADFVSAMFDAWDATASEITHLEFFALTDFDPLVVEQLLDYYGLSSEAFAAYLGSLGLRTWPEAGMNKLAWNRLLSEMSARL